MSNTPSPLNKPITLSVKTGGNVAVKRDINLISNREAQAKVAQRTLFIVLGVAVLLGIAFVAIVLPLQAGALLEFGLKDANSQLSAYTDTDAQFNKLSTEARSLRTMLDSLNATDSQKKSAYDLLGMIEKASPAGVLYTDIEYSINDITLTGAAEKDADVAQLVVNLQTYPQFAQINVQEVGPNEMTLDATATANPQHEKLKRQFIVVAHFPAPLASDQAAAPEATPAAPSNGGSGS